MGARNDKDILLSKKKLKQNFSRLFSTNSASYGVLGQGRNCNTKTLRHRQGKGERLTGDTVLYLTIVTLFMYMNVVNYSNFQ